MKQRIKINGIIIFCSFCVIVIFPRAFFRPLSSLRLEIFSALLGLALILSGQGLRISARGFKSEHSQDGHALIQDGPYALVRNPMYLGILFIGFGIVAMLFQWWVAGIFLAAFILRYIILIFEEEKFLSFAFSNTYPAYQKSVPRLIPALSFMLRRNIRDYFPLKPGWVQKEIGSIIAVLCAVLLLDAWRILFYLKCCK